MWQDQLFSASTARPRPGLPLRFSRSGWAPQGAKGPKAPRFHRVTRGLFLPSWRRVAVCAAPCGCSHGAGSGSFLLLRPLAVSPCPGAAPARAGAGGRGLRAAQGAQPLRTAWARTERGAPRPLWWDFCPISRLVSHVLKSSLFPQRCLTVLKY